MAVPSAVDVMTCGTNSPALPLMKEMPTSTEPSASFTLYSVGSNPNVSTVGYTQMYSEHMDTIRENTNHHHQILWSVQNLDPKLLQ